MKKGKTGKTRRYSTHQGHSGVPRDNVIDLRKLIADDEEIHQPQHSRPRINLSRAMTGFRQRWSDRRTAQQRKKAKEKVVVSHVAKVEPVPPPPPSSKKQTSFTAFQLTPGWGKRIASFAIICAVIVLPVYGVSFYQQVVDAQGKVLGISSSAYDQLRQAGSLASTSEFDEAGQEFRQASQQFIAAEQQLRDAGGVAVAAAELIPNKVKSGQRLLTVGQELSSAGALIADVVGDLGGISINPLGGSNTAFTSFLATMAESLDPIEGHITRALAALEEVRIKDLPEEYQEDIASIQSQLPVLQDRFGDFSQFASVLLTALGHESPQRYLLIFQNSRELRPTGGFIGSIALVDIYQGHIENLEVPGGGVYDVAGQLKEKLIAPKPLWLVNPHWNIQDSNWFADFPTSAEKLMWFYERTGGASVDGVISLTPRVIEQLLELTGPIDMQESYGVVVDSANFVRQAQTYAEVDYDPEENQPKKFIGDLMPRLLNEVFQTDAETLLQLVDTFSAALSNKDFLLNFTDPTIQKSVASLGWDGAVESTSGDYLQVVSTNIAGGKTDHVVDQLIEHEAAVQKDGSIINTVTITRAHRGSSLDRWEGQANVSYVRLYTPLGSQLISTDGFTTEPASRYHLPDLDAIADDDLGRVEQDSIIDEVTGTRITTEFNKTAFGNWISVDPGEIQQVTVTYKLPFRLDGGGLFNASDTYSLLVQKQPGAENTVLTSTINLNDNFDLVWAPDTTQVSGQSVEYITDLVGDQFYGILLK